jgi:hypothetical protein
MNHDQFRNCIGQTLRLQPAAFGPDGRAVDDDWTVVDSDPQRKAATLRNLTRGGDVVVGFDHVKNYDTDPARGDRHGFLNMLWQVRIDRDGRITGGPIPARAAAPPTPEFDPLIVNDGEGDRHLTWASRDEAVALLPEGEARQLYGTFVGLCDALRGETGREPQFDAPNDIRHEIVWELTRDHLSKHKLLGGTGGRHGTAVLVLTGNRARRGPERVANAAPPEVEAVDANYPARSGLQDRLTAEGFTLHWVREENVAGRREEGWEVVIVEDDGRRVTFRVPPGMPSVDPSALVLMKRRN